MLERALVVIRMDIAVIVVVKRIIAGDAYGSSTQRR